MKKDVVNILKLKLLNAIIGSIKLCSRGGKMICRNCGKTIPEHSKFCAYCGMACNTDSSEKEIIKDFVQKEFKKYKINYAILIKIGIILVKIALLYFIIKTSDVGYDQYILTNNPIGIVFFSTDGVEFSAFYAIVGTAVVLLSLFISKFTSGIIDKVFLILPLIPSVKVLFAIITNISMFFHCVGLFYGCLIIASIAMGMNYCLGVLLTSKTSNTDNKPSNSIKKA